MEEMKNLIQGRINEEELYGMVLTYIQYNETDENASKAIVNAVKSILERRMLLLNLTYHSIEEVYQLKKAVEDRKKLRKKLVKKQNEIKKLQVEIKRLKKQK